MSTSHIWIDAEYFYWPDTFPVS